MTREDAHKLVDQLFDMQVTVIEGAADVSGEVISPELPTRVLPADKRVVRTKSSGDRVYLLDETKKTRQWVTNPDVLSSLGFEAQDVADVEDDDLLKYQMASAIYKVN